MDHASGQASLTAATKCVRAEWDGEQLVVQFDNKTKAGLKIRTPAKYLDQAIKTATQARCQYEICRFFGVSWPLGEWDATALNRRYSSSGRCNELRIRQEILGDA